jgi:hypothetical protein
MHAVPLEWILRLPKKMPQDQREWEQFLRKFNEQFLYDGVRAIISEAATIAEREGTDIATILNRIADDGRAADQRFLPQVSAGNVLSLQDVNPLVASADATNATISVAAHNLQYGFGQVSYNSGTIVGLAPSTNYFVYASDPNYQGGAVTYLATTNRQNVTADNGRYFVGAIETAISANTAAIVSATSTNPIVFETGTNHGWSTGNQVTLTALPGDFGTNLNGNDYEITVIDPDHFSIAVDGSAYVAYTTGGLASRISSDTGGGAGGGGGWIDDPYYV